MNRLGFGFVYLLSLGFLLVVFVVSIIFGAVSINLDEIVWFGQNRLSQSHLDHNNISQTIFSEIRLPRATLALSIGALLGMCGAVTQGLFRNPLADPSLIGVTAGASAGASAMIFTMASFSQAPSSLFTIPLAAFIGGLLATFLVYNLATSERGTSVTTMLLVGIAITALAGGLSSGFEYFADNKVLRHISIWKLGGLDNATKVNSLFALVVCCLLLIALSSQGKNLNVLLLGESESRHLGLRVQSIKILLIILVAFGVGVSVALAGVIAFIGLVVPHIMRHLIGANHIHLVPLSAVGGAILLLLSDLLARLLFAPTELPVGLITAFLGAPFFIFLVYRSTANHDK